MSMCAYSRVAVTHLNPSTMPLLYLTGSSWMRVFTTSEAHHHTGGGPSEACCMPRRGVGGQYARVCVHPSMCTCARLTDGLSTPHEEEQRGEDRRERRRRAHRHASKASSHTHQSCAANTHVCMYGIYGGIVFCSLDDTRTVMAPWVMPQQMPPARAALT